MNDPMADEQETPVRPVVERRVATPVDLPRGPPLLKTSDRDNDQVSVKDGQKGASSNLDGQQGSVGPDDGGMKETAGESKAPDGGYGWVIVFAVFCIHIILDGVQFSFGMLFPHILEEFSASKTAAGWIVSMLMGTTFFCGPLASILSTRYGNRIVAIVGALIAFVGAVSGSFAHQVWHLAITYGLVMGIGFGGIYLPAIVSVATWFDKKRALAMGIAVCGSGIGIYALANLIPILIEEYGFRGCLLFEGAIVLNALIFASLLRPLPGKKKTLKADRSDRKHSLEMENLDNKHALAIKEAADNSQRGCWQKLLHKIPVFGLWEYWVMLVVVFLCGVSGYIPFTYLTIRAEREAAVARADTALLVTICGITNLLGRLLAGVLSSQPWCNRYFFYSSASIISGITTAFSVYCTTFTAFAIYGGIYGFTGGVIIALQSVVLSDIVGIERFSGAFGISLFVLGIAALIGTPAAGAIVDAHDGDCHLAFIVFGVIMACGGLVFLPIPLSKLFKSWKRRSPSPRATATSVTA